jgi:hypothetical protein
MLGRIILSSYWLCNIDAASNFNRAQALISMDQIAKAACVAARRTGARLSERAGLCGEPAGAAVNRYPPVKFIEINRVDRICMTMLDKYRSYVIKQFD